jgi:hypothetical protein
LRTGALAGTAAARAAFADRHIATLADDEHDAVKEIYASRQWSARPALPRRCPCCTRALPDVGPQDRDRLHRVEVAHDAAPPDYYLLFMRYAIEQCTTHVHEDTFGHERRAPHDLTKRGDFVGVIKGKGPRKTEMFGPGDVLPPEYAGLEIVVFRDHVSGAYSYNKLAVIARGGNVDAILDHALLQLRLRFS